MQRKPHVVLLYFLIFSLPVYWLSSLNVSAGSVSFAIQYDRILMLVFIAVFILYSLLGRIQPNIRVDGIVLLLFVFNIITALGSIILLVQERPLSVIDQMTTWVQLVINSAFFVIGYNLSFQERDLCRMIRFFVIVAVFTALVGTGQFILINAFGLTELYVASPSVEFAGGRSGRVGALGIYRATSIFIEPRHFGNFVITPLFITAASLFLGDFTLFRRDITVVAVVVLAAGLLVSFSRSAYALTLLSLTLIPVLIFDDVRDALTWYGSGVGIFGVFVSALALTGKLSVLENIVSAFLISKHEFSMLLNFNIAFYGFIRYIRGAYLALVYTLEYPFLGVGLNQAYTYIDFRLAIVTPPFLLLMSVGVPGTLVFFSFVGTLTTRLFTLRQYLTEENTFHRSLLIVGMMFITLSTIKSLVGSRYNYPGTWFWVELTLGAIIYATVRREYLRDDETNADTNHSAR